MSEPLKTFEVSYQCDPDTFKRVVDLMHTVNREPYGSHDVQTLQVDRVALANGAATVRFVEAQPSLVKDEHTGKMLRVGSYVLMSWRVLGELKRLRCRDITCSV